jgi:hypothetical protein
MTPNDVQIDVLMRRYAKHGGGEATPEHLDADELNAFAEGSLPPAARARYVSHLADCDNCRQLVSQLAMSAGAMAKAEPAEATETQPASWSQRLAGFIAPRTLRYAAFAFVLIAAAGVVFLVARRPANNSPLVARNEQANPPAAVKIDDQVAPAANTNQDARPGANGNSTKTESGPTPKASQERDESKVATATVPPPKPGETLPAATPALAMKSAASESRPTYAPPPPGEREGEETKSRPQPSGSGLASGPRKSAIIDDKHKTDRTAAPPMAKDRAADETSRMATNQAPQNVARNQDKRGGPRRSQDNVAQNNQLQIEPSQKESAGTTSSAKPEAAPETRSVGGRKFRRQGGSWIDLKFKTSMSLHTIARGSDDFSSLDSGLRAIASQLSGEIIVVWKNKAYRIQ